MKTLLSVVVIVLLPAVASAGGANTKTGFGDKNGPECDPGFYLDKSANLCVAANWK
ncbi:hypothetical protein [uncultured Shimia sp.]|uniref:hypothetical protein n=1 Tax=uncultured Shimia sp. TaxID=573152 RepID=UPI00262B6639|nr:hypothetical protein [uncultured Shimia sp.]